MGAFFLESTSRRELNEYRDAPAMRSTTLSVLLGLCAAVEGVPAAARPRHGASCLAGGSICHLGVGFTIIILIWYTQYMDIVDSLARTLLTINLLKIYKCD